MKPANLWFVQKWGRLKVMGYHQLIEKHIWVDWWVKSPIGNHYYAMPESEFVRDPMPREFPMGIINMHQLFQKMLEIHEIPNHPILHVDIPGMVSFKPGIIRFPIVRWFFQLFLNLHSLRRFPRKPPCLMTQKGRWCWLSHFKIGAMLDFMGGLTTEILAASIATIHKCCTLWLCQNSYWKWWFIVDFPIKNGDFQ